MTTRSMLGGAVIFAALLLVQCYGNDVGFHGGVVGGDCHDDRNCADLCLGGKDFPQGTCTLECRDDLDCPHTTSCVEKSGGVCLLDCDVDRNCRVDYVCKDVDRHGAGGRAAVCIGR